MRELAVQAANDTNEREDLNAIQEEVSQLCSEINRVGNTTEFNTKKLLKGLDLDVIITPASVNVIAEGAVGIPDGELSTLNLATNSIIGVASTTSLQASTSVATGQVSEITENTISIQGVKSSVTVANGITFTTAALATNIEGRSIRIVQDTTAGAPSTVGYDAGTTTYTFTIGQLLDGTPRATNRGELYNELKSLIDNSINAEIQKLAINVPSNTQEIVSNVTATGTLSGRVQEVAGEYEFSIDIAFKEAGDTITIGGQTFTAVLSGADPTKSEFNLLNAGVIGSVADQALSLTASINANSILSTRFTAAEIGSTITLTEKAGQATGETLTNPIVAGIGTNDRLLITNTGGQNLKMVTLEQNNSDDLSVVTDGNGNLTIKLANATANKNTATKIQALLQALPSEAGIDFTNFTLATEGNWNTGTLGYSLTKANGTLVGGTVETLGSYDFNITQAFKAGDKVIFKGEVFTAVENGALSSNGEFNVANGNIISQAAGLCDAIALNAVLKTIYTATASSSKLTIIETAATGVDLNANELNVRASGTPGEYSFPIINSVEPGGYYLIDGEEIEVTIDVNDPGITNGKAILVGDNASDQATNLIAAINLNSILSTKYTATIGDAGEVVLTQVEDQESEIEPAVSTKNSNLGPFKATFQIGANTGQSFTINLTDMRSSALGITGSGTGFYGTNNVTNGSTSILVEKSLNFLSSEDASNAITVIDIAIMRVSTERSKMGAYQNRLEHTISNLGCTTENLTSAESRIRDVDMAYEMTEFTKYNILNQAATAMLAQANQLPQGLLKLMN
jgi:flagellin